MPTILPDGSGFLRQSVTAFRSEAAWFNGQPLIDSTAGLAYNSQGRSTSAIYCLFANVGGTTVTDIRFPLMSFDVSGISEAPESAELKIFGYSNSGTGDPSSHSSNGIQGWAVNYGGAMASTTSVATSDWGKLASAEAGDGYMPTKYTDNLASWNTGTSTANTFTLTSAALTAIGANDNFQIAIGHKFWWDSAYSNPPFSIALQIINKAKRQVKSKFAFLLPLSYLHGKERYDEVYSDKEYGLKKVYVFTRYPMLGDKLREDGKYKTGMMVYAWFVWENGYGGLPMIDWIDNNDDVLSKKDLERKDLTTNSLSAILDASPK